MQRFANAPRLDFPWAAPLVDGTEGIREMSAEERDAML
jgi:hypothetical protein